MRLSPVPPRAQAAPVIPQDVPVYRVLDEKGFYADDTLYGQGTILMWPDAPNPNLEPMNGMAEEIMIEYLKGLDDEGRKVAQRDKKSHVSQLDAYMKRKQAAEYTATASRVIGAAPQTPLMRAERGEPKARKIDMDGPQPAPILGNKPKQKFSLPRGGKAAVNKAVETADE